ncbi:MAG: energy-coupling factor ABC transporter ATP-binding protein, partial [Clostridiales Family XIII bacterium]|nr:energy-coupling factor ABC transporter ATP-binding protein [Clostridiales Family XIII bacterium]
MGGRVVAEAKHLTFFYADAQGGRAEHPALEDVNLAIEAGSVTALIGPSGCGKTTLCKCLTGVIPKLTPGRLTGEVFVDGREIAGDGSATIGSLSERVGFVLQEPDHQIVMTTAEDDVAFGPENLMRPPREIRASVDAILSDMGLEGKEEVSPSRLSGGEKQRLAVCGALAMGPEAMVFDEPTSNLDAAGKAHFVRLVKALRDMGKTVVVVEHDFEIFDFADRWT